MVVTSMQCCISWKSFTDRVPLPRVHGQTTDPLSPCLRRTTPRASQNKPALARSSEAGGGEQGGERGGERGGEQGGERGWADGDEGGMWEARRGREAPRATSACHQHSLCQQPTNVIRAQQHHRRGSDITLLGERVPRATIPILIV